jgi:ATP-dependent protease HslVU (ClpYQ) peptidase subunit
MREVFEFNRFWAIGSGREFALGAMYAIYDRFEAEQVARTGVDAGCEFDTGSALPMTMYSVIIDKPG